MIEVSHYNSASDTCSVNRADVYTILECIRVGGKDGRIRSIVEAFRADPIANKMMKKSLPVIMWQGVFNYRSDAGLLSLSGLMCIDIDHKTEEELSALRTALMREPWVLSIFRSPSGDGLKVIVKTDNHEPSIYKNCYRQLEKIFEVRYGIAPDNKCEAISQGCFASYDSDIYINPQPTDLHLAYDPAYDDPAAVSQNKMSAKEYNLSAPSPVEAFLGKLGNGLSDEEILEIADKRFARYPNRYKDGFRTKSIFVQSSALCKAGIPYDKALSYLKKHYLPTGYDEEKLEYEAMRGYEKCCSQFGMERGNYRP